MLLRQDFFNIARKSILVILCIVCFTNISFAQLGWESKAPMPTARGWLSTCTVDNYIYALGGALDIGSNLAAVEAFDPLTNTWTTKTPMPTPRGCAAACAVDGIIYVFGGGWYKVYSTVEAYDPLNDTWTTKSPMPTARAGLSVCVIDGIIYAISGFTDMNNPLSTNTVEAYDPKTDTWTIKAPIPTVRAYFSTSVVNGIIYTFGGFNSRGAPSLGNVEAYDPVTNVWTIKNDMPNPRAGMTCYTFGGNIYCFGGVGYGGGPCYSTIITYDPASDNWEEFSNMPYAAFSISSSSLNGKLYFIGGLNNARTPLDIVYEYTPSPISNIQAGNVSGTWTRASSPYFINGEITIPNDSTLTIEPGVDVIFNGNYKFNVKGRLLAIGTETDSILFTVNDTTGFHHLTLPGGGWHGIKILDVASTNDSTIFEYCTFQYGKANTGSGIVNRSGGAINTNLDKLRISHCLFRNNKSYSTDTWEGTSGAILIAGNGIIESCEFCWNESSWGSAMCVGGNTTGAIIRNNHFHHNTGHGTVNICVDAYPIVINNLIEYNHSYGEPSTPHGHGILHFSNNNAGYAKIINNTIVNNTNVGEGGGIFVRDGNPTFINNIIYGNEPSQVNFLWASSVGFYNCLVEGGKEGFTGAAFTGDYINCIDSNPLFIDEANGDYHLSDASPCIGAGYFEEGLTPTCDCEGNLRPMGSNPDIGAYENNLDSPTDVEEYESQVPTKFALAQNYPNPFNPSTKIKYSIPKQSNVSLKIFDVLGREVAALTNKEQSVGNYEVDFEGSELTSGVYFYRLQAGNFVETKRMVLLR